jgi:hypothetical protein
MCVSASAVNFKLILALMAEVDWEVKDVMSQHSQYVDILLRVRETVRCRTLDNALSEVTPVQKQ